MNPFRMSVRQTLDRLRIPYKMIRGKPFVFVQGDDLQDSIEALRLELHVIMDDVQAWGQDSELHKFLHQCAIETVKLENRAKGLPIIEQALAYGWTKLTITVEE